MDFVKFLRTPFLEYICYMLAQWIRGMQFGRLRCCHQIGMFQNQRLNLATRLTVTFAPKIEKKRNSEHWANEAVLSVMDKSWS